MKTFKEFREENKQGSIFDLLNAFRGYIIQYPPFNKACDIIIDDLEEGREQKIFSLFIADLIEKKINSGDKDFMWEPTELRMHFEKEFEMNLSLPVESFPYSEEEKEVNEVVKDAWDQGNNS